MVLLSGSELQSQTTIADPPGALAGPLEQLPRLREGDDQRALRLQVGVDEAQTPGAGADVDPVVAADDRNVRPATVDRDPARRTARCPPSRPSRRSASRSRTTSRIVSRSLAGRIAGQGRTPGPRRRPPGWTRTAWYAAPRARARRAAVCEEVVVDDLGVRRADLVELRRPVAPQRDLLQADQIRIALRDLTCEQLRAGGEVGLRRRSRAACSSHVERQSAPGTPRGPRSRPTAG